MKLPPTAPNMRLDQLTSLRKSAPQQAQGDNIGASFEQMLQDVNKTQHEAEVKQTEFLTSDKKDLHGTIIAMEKGDLSMRLMLQVRKKMVNAYEEVMRMQV